MSPTSKKKADPQAAALRPSAEPGVAESSSLPLYVGTSGWSYTIWKPAFYPQDVASKNFLKVLRDAAHRRRSELHLPQPAVGESRNRMDG